MMRNVVRREMRDRRSERYRSWIDPSYLQISSSSQLMRFPIDLAMRSQKTEITTPVAASVSSIDAGTRSNCAIVIARSTACDPIHAPFAPDEQRIGMVHHRLKFAVVLQRWREGLFRIRVVHG